MNLRNSPAPSANLSYLRMTASEQSIDGSSLLWPEGEDEEEEKKHLVA